MLLLAYTHDFELITSNFVFDIVEVLAGGPWQFNFQIECVLVHAILETLHPRDLIYHAQHLPKVKEDEFAHSSSTFYPEAVV